MSEEAAAWPIADDALSQKLLNLVQQATQYRQIRKGANECEKFAELSKTCYD